MALGEEKLEQLDKACCSTLVKEPTMDFGGFTVVPRLDLIGGR